MRRFGLAVICLLAVLLVPQTTFAQSLTGSWSGNYTSSFPPPGCTGVGARSFSGTMFATFSQSGSSFTGFVTLNGFKDVVDTGPTSCRLIDITVGSGVHGTISGSNVTMFFDIDEKNNPFTGTLSGNTLSMSFRGSDGETQDFTLTRSEQASVDLSGTWRGSYHITTPCTGTSTGEMTASFSQNLGNLTGSVTIPGVKMDISGQCQNIITTTVSAEVRGIVTGNAFTVLLLDAQGEVQGVLNGTIRGTTLSGTISGEFEGTGGFSLSRSGPGAAPNILSFFATPNSIRAGDSVSLSWTTSNASSVSIDNGVGSQPPSGSLKVSPSATTTYTLIANGPGGTSTASVTVEVVAVADVRVTLLPSGLVQPANTGGATATYTLFNAGGAPASITLSQNGSFFTQSPTNFTLDPGASQIVTITGVAQPAGTVSGASIPLGNGVPAGLSIPITLLSAEPPNAPAIAVPTTNRVDVSEPPGVNPSGTVSFTNRGTGKVSAVVTSSVSWLGVGVPGPITVDPGATAVVNFTIDRSKRPDAAAPIGSVSGNLILSYLSGSAGKIGQLNGPGVSNSFVTVVDTARPATSTAAIPPLQPGEVAYFIPGAGHVQGSVGLFLSDISILNHSALAGVSDIKIYYTRAGGDPSVSAAVSLPQVAANQPLALADIVKATFLKDAEVGTLQIRTSEFDKISLAANVFNSSNPAGTYGTVIPVFRSDRSIGPGAKLHLTGLRSDESSHTNLFLQETAGATAKVTAEFFNAVGASLGTRTESLSAFGLLQIGNVVPLGAVSATVTNEIESSGKIVAYATPVDRLSGDTWTVVDWRQQLGYSPAEPAIIPVAGSVRGANNSFFRTDVALMNSGAIAASGTLRYIPQTGEAIERPISLQPSQSQIVSDIVGTLFGLTSGTVGYLVYTPVSGTLALTSRTYTTVAGQNATFGTGVPTVALSSSLKLGQLQRIGGLEDAALSTIGAARPGTYRTNVGLLETSGQPATVRITLRYSFVAGKTETRGTAAREFPLGPRQFLQVNNITRQILGAGRDTTLSDAKNVQLDFELVSGEGSVIVFTSSLDNGTNDSTLRIE